MIARIAEKKSSLVERPSSVLQKRFNLLVYFPISDLVFPIVIPADYFNTIGVVSNEPVNTFCVFGRVKRWQNVNCFDNRPANIEFAPINTITTYKVAFQNTQ